MSESTPSDAPAEEVVIPPRILVSAETDGGHEVDQPPNMALFAMLTGLVVVIILSAIGIFQLFVSESTAQIDERLNVTAKQLVTSRENDDRILGSYGTLSLDDQKLLRVPIDEAKRLVLDNPARFTAAPAPEGWVHPDDVQ